MSTSWQETLDYLYSLANWETRPPGTELAFELDRVRRVLSALGDPQRSWPAVHVGGTNGKGSTCAMVASALRACGYRVGLFTSPHLHTVRERVRVNQRLIDESQVRDWLNAHRRVLDAEPGLTTFEALTVLAFDHFRSSAVDVAVVEVGLGGRLDTTNVVRPCVTAITPIALDHMKVLGDTIGAIAADKSGIVKPDVPLVIADQAAEALAVLEAAAARNASPLVRVGRDIRLVSSRRTRRGQTVDVDMRQADRTERRRLDLGLAGAHQQQNAMTAVGVLIALANAGWDVPNDRAMAGLEAARWPGRFEWLAESPVVIVDGAHNAHAATALTNELAARFGDRRMLLVIGASCDKDVTALLRPMLSSFERVFATRSEHPRAMAPGDLGARCRALGVSCREVDLPRDALVLALAEATPDDVVVAAGSIFLAADIREAWAELGRMPMPPRDPPPAAPRGS